MSAALKIVQTDDLQTRATAAQAESDRLGKAARDAETKAQLAKLAFVAAPKTDTHAEYAIAEQLAKNARRDSDAHTAEVAPLLHEAATERHATTLASTIEIIQHDVTITKQRERIAEIVVELRRTMRGAILDLDAAIMAHNAQRLRATQLSQQLGRHDDYRTIAREQVLAQLNESLRGPNRDHEMSSVALSVFNSTGNPRKEQFQLQITDFVAAP